MINSSRTCDCSRAWPSPPWVPLGSPRWSLAPLGLKGPSWQDPCIEPLVLYHWEWQKRGRPALVCQCLIVLDHLGRCVKSEMLGWVTGCTYPSGAGPSRGMSRLGSSSCSSLAAWAVSVALALCHADELFPAHRSSRGEEESWALGPGEKHPGFIKHSLHLSDMDTSPYREHMTSSKAGAVAPTRDPGRGLLAMPPSVCFGGDGILGPFQVLHFPTRGVQGTVTQTTECSMYWVWRRT